MKKYIIEMIDRGTGMSLGYVNTIFYTIASKDRAKIFRSEEEGAKDVLTDMFTRFKFCFSPMKKGPTAMLAEYCRLKFFKYMDIDDVELVAHEYQPPVQVSMFSEHPTMMTDEEIEYFSKVYTG